MDDKELLKAIIDALIAIDQRFKVLPIDIADIIYNKAVELERESGERDE